MSLGFWEVYAHKLQDLTLAHRDACSQGLKMRVQQLVLLFVARAGVLCSGTGVLKCRLYGLEAPTYGCRIQCFRMQFFRDKRLSV